MGRKKRKFFYPLPDRVVAAVEAVVDPNQRSIAAYDVKMIGDTVRTRAILASCVAHADAFYAAVAANQLVIRAVPLGKPRLKPRRKVYVPPNRLPPLFERAAEPALNSVETVSLPPDEVSGADLVAELAPATLDLVAEGHEDFIDLVATPGFREAVAYLQANPPPRLCDWMEMNLFRDFGVDVGSPTAEIHEADVPEPSPARRRRRKRGPRPVGTDLIAMGSGHE